MASAGGDGGGFELRSPFDRDAYKPDDEPYAAPVVGPVAIPPALEHLPSPLAVWDSCPAQPDHMSLRCRCRGLAAP